MDSLATKLMLCRMQEQSTRDKFNTLVGNTEKRAEFDTVTCKSLTVNVMAVAVLVVSFVVLLTSVIPIDIHTVSGIRDISETALEVVKRFSTRLLPQPATLGLDVYPLLQLLSRSMLRLKRT